MTENAETLFVASEDIATALNLLESIEVEIGFDSDDPESVEQAILAVEEAINARLSGHRGDAVVVEPKQRDHVAHVGVVSDRTRGRPLPLREDGVERDPPLSLELGPELFR